MERRQRSLSAGRSVEIELRSISRQ